MLDNKQCLLYFENQRRVLLSISSHWWYRFSSLFSKRKG